ncbi:MAG: hypothetical protein QNK23_14285 [Crocinitomicaceae bacterium]|nr:hypothetical protein [Crocinitomicaceae bacterium]
MSLVPNAAPDELDSPFYIQNEKLCKKWEEYILARGGQIKGKYNAWSYTIHTKVESNHTWLIDIKKATYSNGNLLLSSKYQNLLETLTFTAIFMDTDCKNFYIGKSFFKRQSRQHPFYDQIKDLVKRGEFNKSLYEVKFKDSRLTIVFHHQNDWFDMADRILAFDQI